MILKFPISPEQEEVLVDHLVYGHQLGLQPDERVWIRKNVDKLMPKAKIISADLDIDDAAWIVEVTE